MRRSHSDPQAPGSLSSSSSLWRLLNAPKPIDAGWMRLACAIFLVTYAGIAGLRYEESHHAFFWLRLSICAYAALGIWLAGRVTWTSARAYAIGLALLLPLQAAYIDGMLGNHVGEVAVSALATFVPLVFIQAGRDLIVVDLALVVGHVVVLAVVPSPAAPLAALGVMVGGALATGTVACLQALIYRARWTQSVDQLRQALATSAAWKSRYDSASLASGQILYDCDPHTNDARYAGSSEHMLGYTLEELANGVARWIDLIHPDDRAGFEHETRRSVERTEPRHLQYRARRKDGRYIIVEDSGHFVFDDGIMRLVGFVSDVTERATAEAARAEEAAIAAALARVGRELISSLETPVLLDRLCRLTTEVLRCDFSHTWLWSPDEEVYTPIAQYGVSTDEWETIQVLRVPSSPSSPLFAQLARADIAQITSASTEYPVTAGMLAYFGASVVLCVGLKRRGEIIAIHSAGRRTGTDAFTNAEERLAGGIAHLASMALTNAQLVEELERASRLKSEFVSTMSHELRTPLNVIIGYTDMLKDKVTSEESATLLDRVRKSSLELLEMIESTLDLNRLAAGKDLPQLEPVPLAALWDELAAEFAALPSPTDVALHWTPVGMATLHTDRRKLKMILKNLVGNALKFTPAGEVRVGCERAADGAEITVRDTGIGIRPEHVPHIFEMFRQVDSSDKRSYGGAGLGLYIVRQLADQLGGTVGVESGPGRGSTFHVVLPAGRDATAAGAAA